MHSALSQTAWTACVLLAAWFVAGASVGAGYAESLSAGEATFAELRNQVQGEEFRAPAANNSRSDVFSQAPTLSGRLRVSEQTLIPYIGAGFGGGFVTERDRALHLQPVVPQQNLFGDSIGKGMMPNEFQMGIRIPF